MVKEVKSSSEFYSEIRKKNLTVAKFSASWCGPCVQIAPFVDQLSRKYPNVNFIGIDVDSNPVAQEVGVRSMPTFHFYIDGRKVDELIGANPGVLESKVIQHKVDVVEAFAGKGFTMSGADAGAASPADAQSMREARLKAFNAAQLPPPPAPKVENNLADMVVAAADEDDAELARAIAESLAQSSDAAKPTAATTTAAAEQSMDVDGNEDGDGDEEMMPVPVDEAILKEMMEMGFSDVRARKSIVHGKTLEGALQWISEHEDDPEIDQPYLVKKSSLEPKRELTEEEKAQKVLALKEKIRLKKEQKEREEKEREIQREKERRERGKSTTEIQEERDRLMRKREAEKQKKEKMVSLSYYLSWDMIMII